MVRSRTGGRARWWWIGGGAAAILAVIAGLIFQPWLLFVDVRVADAIPAPAGSVAATIPSAPSGAPPWMPSMP